MITFQSYESKPVTRQAFQITDKHSWTKVGESEYIISEDTDQTTNLIRFKAYQEPVIGDWIVRLTAEDTYHCTDAVFRERNVVPE